MNEEPDHVTSPIGAADIAGIDKIEHLFFAYRDFVGDADRILAEFGFGRAHHRALYFVNRKPGMTVAALLDILKITKQSLARVLRQLIDSGYIIQSTGANDRRRRLLYPTRKGRELILKLSAPQSRRIEKALENLDPDAREAVSRFLENMINPQDR